MVKKYLCEPKPGFIYVRVKGKYIGRIIAPKGTADFDRRYWEILSGKTVECKTSWKHLIASYRRSDRWERLKPRTRADYEKVMVYILEKNGARDATRVIRKDIIAAMEANRHRVRFANEIPNVMAVLLHHAIDIGWMRDNPAKGIRRLPMPDDKKQPHNVWTDAAVAKFRKNASPAARLIMELGIGSVQRPDDWTRFTWGDYDGESLVLRQGKTGKELTLPCSAILKATLDAEKARLTPHPSRHILTKPSGARMSYDYMAKVMRAERHRLGLMKHDLHAMRYRGVQELAWAGCTDDEICSYSGHETRKMVEKYAGEARQIMRAREAKKKRDRG